MSQRIYSFEDVSVMFVAKAANYTERRYRLYDIQRDDVSQEIYVWLYGTGKAKVERWLENEPQQTTRIYRSMLDRALGYAEREKAVKVGYKVDDVWWYTPSMIDGLMPLVLDETFHEDSGQVGELATSVLDVRAVLDPNLRAFFCHHDSSHPNWEQNIQTLVNRLGGDRPYIGRRRVMTNAAAQAATRNGYDGE